MPSRFYFYVWRHCDKSPIPNGIYVFTHENHLETYFLPVYGNQLFLYELLFSSMIVIQKQSYWCVSGMVREALRALPVKTFEEIEKNKQTWEESVVRKSVRLQPGGGRGQSSPGEQTEMEGKLEWPDSKDQKSRAHSGFLSEKMRIQARSSDSQH